MGTTMVDETPGDAGTDLPATDLGHEFRTPLNAVIGLSESLLADPQEAPTPHQRSALIAIRSAGLRLLGLVESEVDDGVRPSSASLVLRRVDVGRTVQRLCDTLRERLAARDVFLGEPDLEAGLFAAADPVLLRRSLSAMIAHVLDHHPAGAEIAVTVRRGRDFVETAIAGRRPCAPRRPIGDAGPFGGSGAARGRPLGGPQLPEARREALAMNGRIEHGRLHGPRASTHSPGLVLLLPPATPDRPGLNATGLTRAPSRFRPRPLILCVEDHPANIMLMRRVLGALGDFDLYVAETGPMGLKMAQDIRPDLILLDINLPGLDGFQVMSALSGDDATRTIPVVAVTANASASDRSRGAKAGFFDYLIKPLDIAALAATLNLILGDGMAGIRRAPPPDAGRAMSRGRASAGRSRS